MVTMRGWLNKMNGGLVRHIGVLLGIFLAGHVSAAEATTDREWNYLAELYLWGPDIDIETVDGTHQEIKFSDLVDITKGGFMGGLYGQRGKWRFGVDGIYLEADDRINVSLVEGLRLSEAELQVWYAAPMIAYQLASYDQTEFYVYGGARFLWAEYTAVFKTDPPLPPEKFQSSESDDIWDGFVGLHGITRLSDKWFLSYQADIGAGDSDATYQVAAGLNYRFTRFSLGVGYRYLAWDMDSSLFNELEFNGFYAGGRIYF